MMKRVGLTGLLLVTLSGCSLLGHESQTVPPRQDELIGQIIDARSGQPLDYSALLERAAEADVVYLAERHDNAEHHQIQLRIIQGLIELGQRPVLGFEFFDIGQSGYLSQYVNGQASLLALGPGSKQSPEQRLRRQLGWEKRPDQEWGYYFQLIELARQHQLEIFGADLPPSIKLRLSRTDIDQLSAVERQQLQGLELEQSPYREFMYRRFVDGHCGWGEEPLLTRLYRTWRERNFRMAASLVAMADTAQGGPVVMIVGAGHTEHNLGLVSQAERLNPTLKQLNIGLQQISIDPRPLADYRYDPDDAERKLGVRHDLLWFTQRQDYRDLCAELNGA
ncbi:ChaN family lipoprotein [Motiliproteus sp.]|uniref:ChaN family lipoprotein n=1 Tax=Motiliproteus sp. TaxID=1898955 RepID=UPI003BADB81E